MSFLVCVSSFSRFLYFLSFLTCYVGFDVSFSMHDVWNSLCRLTPKWTILSLSIGVIVCIFPYIHVHESA